MRLAKYNVKLVDNCTSNCVGELMIESDDGNICQHALIGLTFDSFVDEYYVTRYTNRWVMRNKYQMHSVVIEKI
jgi:hypothetical protein